jgi:DNA polymerase I
MDVMRSPQDTRPLHLVLLDANHLMHRAYWAIQRSLSTSSGEQTNTVFGVTSMLLTLLSREHPDVLIACFDEGKETVRHKAYKDYKAGRAETPDDFYIQIPRVLQCFEAFAIPMLSDPKYEADDLIGTLAVSSHKAGFTVTIVTGDRDLFQMANAGIRVAIPHKGYTEPQYLNAEGVREKLGVSPGQIPDYKGLTGDPSDNLKGVSGIGPKTAATLLQTYGTLEEVYAHLGDIRQGVRKKLEEDRESAFFCRDLARIITDVPGANIETASWQASTEKVVGFLSELEFHTLRRRLQDLQVRDEFFQSHLSGTLPVDMPLEPELNDRMTEEQLPLLD